MPIPHSKKLGNDFEEFLEDLRTSLIAFTTHAAKDPDAKGIFKYATASHCVLTGFAQRHPHQLLSAAAGISRRVAVLMATRQLSLLKVELRRLLECALWYCYFIDHPVEWAEFLSDPQRSWDEKAEAPIASAACAPIGKFRSYARERMNTARCSEGAAAVDTARACYEKLSGEVHAAFGAVHPSGTLALAFDSWDTGLAGAVRSEVEKVFVASIVIFTATKPEMVHGLDAINRDWFDWLVGDKLAKRIRSASFGLTRP